MTTQQLIHIFNTLAFAGPSAPTAYIDPNTGGMIFQLLAVFFGLFSGILFFFSRQIRSGFAKLRRKMRGEAEPTAEEEQATESVDQEPVAEAVNEEAVIEEAVIEEEAVETLDE